MKLPPGRGGWWHDYVCPAHGMELVHEGLTSGVFPPAGARCRHGCLVDTPKVRGAWTVLAHQACAADLGRLAVVDPAAAVVLLEEYAERYAAAPPEHDGAAGWMLRGRLFHQALTEAIWAVRIGTVATVLDAVPELRAALGRAMADARATLVAQDRFTSNYTAWLNAAGAVCTGAPEWLTGEHGVYAHVLAATDDEGWEWEGSTYYHVFVLRAYLLALRDVPDSELPVAVLDRLRAMVDVVVAISTPGGLVPALHDSPYARPETGAEYAELWSLVAGRGWSYAPGSWRGVTVYRGVGYAVLRGNGIHAIVDFGPHGGSHGHRDKLALYLYGFMSAWQPDPGQVPYGHAHWRSYYASTAAHPTFRVDGLDQAECTGTLVHADSTGVEVAAEPYPGVRAVRAVSIVEGALIDRLTVTCDRPREVALALRPAVPLTVRADGPVLRTYWGVAEELWGEHVCGDARLAVAPGPGPANDPQWMVTHVDWVAPQVTEVTFAATYRRAQR